MKPSALIKIRKKVNLGQKEMASLLGFSSQGTVSNLESGTRKPTGPIKMLYKYIQRFGLLEK